MAHTNRINYHTTSPVRSQVYWREKQSNVTIMNTQELFNRIAELEKKAQANGVRYKVRTSDRQGKTRVYMSKGSRWAYVTLSLTSAEWWQHYLDKISKFINQ